MSKALLWIVGADGKVLRVSEPKEWGALTDEQVGVMARRVLSSADIIGMALDPMREAPALKQRRKTA